MGSRLYRRGKTTYKHYSLLMKTEKLSYEGRLIIVRVILFGKNNEELKLKLALDTGSNQTIIRPAYLETLGYKLSEGKSLIVTTGSQNDKAIEVTVNKLSVFGIEAKNIQAVAKTLPRSLFFIDGLLGLDFFQKTKTTLCLDFDKLQVTIK
jgi:predicted aspartyl protease